MKADPTPACVVDSKKGEEREKSFGILRMESCSSPYHHFSDSSKTHKKNVRSTTSNNKTANSSRQMHGGHVDTVNRYLQNIRDFKNITTDQLILPL